MREIKFRYIIRSKETKKIFVQEYTLERIQKGNIINKEVYEIVDILQFTGLKDKNGKEIFEGDIVKINAEGSDWNMEVFMSDFCIDYQESRMENDYEGEVIIEVIGNKFENPKLLK